MRCGIKLFFPTNFKIFLLHTILIGCAATKEVKETDSVELINKGVAFSLLTAGDYVITINGTSKEIGLDQETTLVLPDGTSLKLKLHQKQYLHFTGDLFSFDHKSKYKPIRNDLGDGVFQTIIVSPRGTGIIVQEYLQKNPTKLVDMMLHELTKEEVEYGYKYSEKPVRKKVRGITFNGKQAVTTYLGEEYTRSILAYGGKDKGIIIVTQIEKDI